MKSRWTRPFVVKTVFSHGAIEICDPKNGNEFKVNSQRLKPFLKSVPKADTAMGRFDPILVTLPFCQFISCIHTLSTMHEIGVGEGSNIT